MQFNKRTQLTTAIVTLLFTAPVWATNGYFMHGTGTKNKSMAGSGLAMPEDAISVANNPAAALANTGKYDLAISVFSPNRNYQTSDSQANGNGGAFTIGPNDLKSNNEYYFIPNMAGSWKIDDESAWAAAFYGKGGMNTSWNGGTATFDPDGPGPAAVMTLPGTYGGGLFGGSGAAGVDLSQAFLDLVYAHSAGEHFTWGVSLVAVAQLFAARGVGTFAAYTESFAASGGTAFPDSLSNNGHDQSYGVGGKAGIQWNMSDNVSFAASYETKIGMSKLDEYSDLFAGHGNFDIPADLKVGLTFRPNPGLALNFDIENIWYSDVVSVGNLFSKLFSCPTANPLGTALENCLGGSNGAGFGWQDMTVYKIGAQWGSGDDWTWRAGYSHGDQPIPDSEVMFNILAPGVIEDHATFGFSRKLTAGDEFSVAFMWAFNKKVSGVSPLDPTQTVSFDMDEWEIEFSYGWR
jgi:long-chain fatty acid transport protein